MDFSESKRPSAASIAMKYCGKAQGTLAMNLHIERHATLATDAHNPRVELQQPLH
jgi:hypothetical protein